MVANFNESQLEEIAREVFPAMLDKALPECEYNAGKDASVLGCRLDKLGDIVNCAG